MFGWLFREAFRATLRLEAPRRRRPYIDLGRDAMYDSYWRMVEHHAREARERARHSPR